MGCQMATEIVQVQFYNTMGRWVCSIKTYDSDAHNHDDWQYVFGEPLTYFHPSGDDPCDLAAQLMCHVCGLLV